MRREYRRRTYWSMDSLRVALTEGFQPRERRVLRGVHLVRLAKRGEGEVYAVLPFDPRARSTPRQKRLVDGGCGCKGIREIAEATAQLWRQ